MLRRLRAIADQPAVAVILLLLMAADLWCIGSRHHRINTTASDFLSNAVRPRHTGYSRYTGKTLSWRENWIGAELIQRGDGQWVTSLFNRPADHDPLAQYLGSVSLSTYKGPRGFYAATWKGVRITCDTQLISQNNSSAVVAARAILIDRMNRGTLYFNPLLNRSQTNRLSITGVLARGRHLPLGYLHNTLSAILFTMLAWSLWLNIPKLPRALGRLRRRDPNRCPHCGYSTVGLPSSTCPECGHTRPLPPSA